MTLRGVIHGRTIELVHEVALPEGQQVEVTIETTPTAATTSPWWLDYLDVDPALASGRFIIKGTRLQADTLVTLLEQGQTEEDLLRTYPELTREAVTAVREYAKVPVDLRRSFGAWAQDAQELDKFLEETYRFRRAPLRSIEE